MIPIQAKIAVALLALLAAFYGGMRYERAGWLASAARQAQQAHKDEQRATTTSESVADTSRAAAATATDSTRKAESSAIEKIRYVYRDAPPAACPASPLPDGVRRVLEEADAALAAAR